MSYLHWLLGISAAFVLLEQLFPWRKERLLRPGWLRDVGFVALNGHFFSALTAGLTGAVALAATRALHVLGLSLEGSPVPRWPFVGQFLLFLVLADFLQWCIHNLLHRVPWLWTFHKVHHSITTMDWIGNWRFHWAEIVVYKSLQWLPLAWLNASPEAVFAVAVVTTVWGDFNHANLDVGLGPMGYVLNNPRMHLWHHDQSSEGGAAKNFGIVLSLWDHLFGTAFWPRDRSPERLGYPGIEEMPRTFPGQVFWPVTRRRDLGPRPDGGVHMSMLFGLALLAGVPEAQAQVASSPWSAVQFMVGDWTGESEGQPGKGTVKRTYRFVLGDKFLHEQNVSTYPPQPMNPKGEVHEHWSLFSHDRARHTLVFRQFHQEGFVNQYVMTPGTAAGTVVFETEALENIPPGWKARETYQLVSPDEFIESFELAPVGGAYEVYSQARFKRVSRP